MDISITKTIRWESPTPFSSPCQTKTISTCKVAVSTKTLYGRASISITIRRWFFSEEEAPSSIH